MNASPPKYPHPLRPLWIAAVVVLVLVGAGWAVMTALFPPARVRAIVQDQLARTLNRDVRFGSAGIGLFPVRLEVNQVAMSEAGGFARGIAFQASAIELNLDVMALLSRRIVVKKLALEQPGLHLVLRADGTTNLDNLVKQSPSRGAVAKPMDFTVDEFVLDRARLLVDDLKVNARRTIVIDSKISLSSRGQGRQYATAGTTTLAEYAFGPVSAPRLGDLDQSLAKLALVIEHKGVFDTERKRLALEKLDLGLGHAWLGLAGVIDDPGPNGRYDLKARSGAPTRRRCTASPARAASTSICGSSARWAPTR